MSTAGTLISFALTAASFVYPPAAPILAIISKLESYGEAALPILKDAVTQGPDAFAAAKAAAPGLFGHLTDFLGQLKLAQGNSSEVSDSEVAVMAAHIVGVDPPGWTHADTQRWWDRAQGNQGS